MIEPLPYLVEFFCGKFCNRIGDRLVFGWRKTANADAAEHLAASTFDDGASRQGRQLRIAKIASLEIRFCQSAQPDVGVRSDPYRLIGLALRYRDASYRGIVVARKTQKKPVSIAHADADRPGIIGGGLVESRRHKFLSKL